MEALLAFFSELVAENEQTMELRRAVEARDEKEKAEIASAKQTLISWWTRHLPNDPLPPQITGTRPPTSSNGTNANSAADPTDSVKQSLVSAFDQIAPRFTTKDFFPLVPEISLGEAPESQGYDFLRRQIEEGKLWVLQQGAGRRPTTYSKERVPPLTVALNRLAAIADEISDPPPLTDDDLV